MKWEQGLSYQACLVRNTVPHWGPATSLHFGLCASKTLLLSVPSFKKAPLNMISYHHVSRNLCQWLRRVRHYFKSAWPKVQVLCKSEARSSLPPAQQGEPTEGAAAVRLALFKVKGTVGGYQAWNSDLHLLAPV